MLSCGFAGSGGSSTGGGAVRRTGDLGGAGDLGGLREFVLAFERNGVGLVLGVLALLGIVFTVSPGDGLLGERREEG